METVRTQVNSSSTPQKAGMFQSRGFSEQTEEAEQKLSPTTVQRSLDGSTRLGHKFANIPIFSPPMIQASPGYNKLPKDSDSKELSALNRKVTSARGVIKAVREYITKTRKGTATKNCTLAVLEVIKAGLNVGGLGVGEAVMTPAMLLANRFLKEQPKPKPQEDLKKGAENTTYKGKTKNMVKEQFTKKSLFERVISQVPFGAATFEGFKAGKAATRSKGDWDEKKSEIASETLEILKLIDEEIKNVPPGEQEMTTTQMVAAGIPKQETVNLKDNITGYEGERDALKAEIQSWLEVRKEDRKTLLLTDKFEDPDREGGAFV